FSEEHIERIARTEPTLRDMLQQFRHLFDHLIYGGAPVTALDRDAADGQRAKIRSTETPTAELPAQVKSVIVIESPVSSATPKAPPSSRSNVMIGELWEQEIQSARAQLAPDCGLTGATRELQAGLGSFLQLCHEHGVKVGPWRLQHVVPEWSFGDHPTYGVVTIAHWACKDAQPWKVGIGLFLARGAGKPKDLEVKLSVMDVQPVMVDHLILLRPEEAPALPGRGKSLWQAAGRRGRPPRLEPASLDGFAQLYSFPRWLAAVRESLPEGTPLPNLADVIQEKCEQVLPQLCMPVQG